MGGLKPENKGIALVGICAVAIIAAIMKQWGTVDICIVGLFALLNLN